MRQSPLKNFRRHFYEEFQITDAFCFSGFFHCLESGLTLPHSYHILYSTTGTSKGSTGIEWTFNLTEFAVNQNLAASTFDIDTK